MNLMKPFLRQGNPWAHAFSGTQLAITVIVFSGAGYYLDKKFDTEPWWLVAGMVIGIVGGLYNFLKEYLHDPHQKH